MGGRQTPHACYAVTISLKSAMPEKPRSTCRSEPRCAPRTAGSGSSTITLSKNASTVGPQRGDQCQRLAIISLLAQLSNLGRERRSRIGELLRLRRKDNSSAAA